MANEQFLIVTYFGAGFLCLCFSAAAYFWLRPPAAALFASLQSSGLGRALKKLLPASLVALALSGFMSVSYYGGCNAWSYQEIISDRAYMLNVNRWQMEEAFDWIARTALAWSGIAILVIVAIRRERSRSGSRAVGTLNEPR